LRHHHARGSGETIWLIPDLKTYHTTLIEEKLDSLNECLMNKMLHNKPMSALMCAVQIKIQNLPTTRAPQQLGFPFY
jgi:hypothetical protein